MDASAVQIEQLIGGILTPQQDIHQQAQDEYFRLQNANPSQLFLSLGTILKHSQQRTARLFAAVILRQQSLPSKTLIDQVDPNVITQLKAIAMDMFQTEPENEMRRKVIEFAAVFASRLFTRSQSPNPADAWPEILQLTCQGAAMTEQPVIQASCFDMIAQISEYCVAVFNGQEQMVVQLLSNAINDTVPIEVAVAASTAALTLIVSYRELHQQETQPNVPINEQLVGSLQNAIDAYAKAVPLVCRVFARALNEQREGILGQFLHFLDHTINLHPSSFSSSFASLIDLIISIGKHPDLEPSFREKCLALLVRFGTSPAGRSLCRKEPTYQQKLLSLSFEFLLDIDYTPEWANDPLYATSDQDDWPNFHLGLFLIRSLPATMGVKAFLTPLLQEIFTRAANQQNWKQPHAALNVLVLLCEDHIKSFPKPAITTVQTMLVQLSNPKITAKANPRVTVACFQAIVSFATKLGQKTSKEVLGNILAMLPADVTQLTQIPPTMVFYTSRTLAVLLGALTKDNVKPYLPRILPAISACLSHPISSIVNSALTSTSACALQLNTDFSEYADQIVPALCSRLQQSNVEIEQYLTSGSYKSDNAAQTALSAQHSIRNKSIETLSFIAEALGHDHFIKHSAGIMALISQSQQLETKYPNPTMQYIFEALSRIADSLQEDFGPYLGSILPGLLHAAAASDFHFRFDLDADLQMTQADSIEAAALSDRGFISQTVSLHGRGAQRVVINAAVIQDKIQALELLGTFAISLKEAFGPFLEQTAQVLFPECHTTANPRIRWSATAAIPALLECLYHQPGVTPEQVLSFFSNCITAFNLPVWITKELPEGLTHLVQATSACIDAVHIAGIPALSPELLQIVSNAFLEGWKICLERRLSIEQEVMTGDEEQVELKVEAIQIENAALDALVQLNTELLRTNREAYYPFFIQCVEPLFAAGIGPDNETTIDNKSIKRDPYLHTCSLIGYADSIGNSGAGGVPLIQKTFPIFMRDALNPEDHELRRGAAYGITACHRALPMADFAQFVPAALDTLAKSAKLDYDPPPSVDYDEDEAESSSYAQDNALAGLTDIMNRYGCGFPTPTCIHSSQEQANYAAIEGFINTQYIVQYMPVVVELLARFHDEEEAARIHHNFALWLDKCPQTVYGPGNANLPHVVRIVAHILDLDLEYHIAEESDLEIYKNTWRNIRSSMPPDVITKLLTIIDKEIVGMLNFD